MKKLLVFIVFFFPAYLSAQTTGRIINRVDREESSLLKHEVRTDAGSWPDRPLLIQSVHGTAKSFKFSLLDSIVTGDAGAAPELSGTITNTTTQQIKIIFERTHLQMDTDVSSGVCLCNCYADNLDALPPNGACALDTGIASWTFLFHPHTIFGHSISHPDTIIDYIKLTALSGDPGDTVAFILKGVLMPVDAVQDQQRQNVANPRITAIYPSPLIQGNAIKVKVTSPRESNLSYSIYDGIGRIVALGATRQHITHGDNTVGIGSLDGLVNGSYMLKFTFGDGSSDTHFFQVLR